MVVAGRGDILHRVRRGSAGGAVDSAGVRPGVAARRADGSAGHNTASDDDAGHKTAGHKTAGRDAAGQPLRGTRSDGR